LCLFSSLISTNGFSFSSPKTLKKLPKPYRQHTIHEKYLYWGSRIDCPGKHCESCEGLGHQESSLRCALEEAMFLNRCVFLFAMCIKLCFFVFKCYWIWCFFLVGFCWY
jgi:hypothetical protein